MTWPPAWSEPEVARAGRAVPAREYPPPGWPTKAQLDYTQQAILLGLLVLALPWLVTKLVTRPSDVLASLGQSAVRKAGA